MNLTQLNKPFAYLVICSALLASHTARADNADLDVPGPVGRSWVAIDGSYSHARSDSEYSSTGQALSSSRTSNKMYSLGGSFAADERVNILVLAYRQEYRATYSSPYSPSDTFSDSSNAGSLGLRVRPLGTATSEGFGLSGSVWVSHAEGVTNIFSADVQPQFRFSNTLVAATTLGFARHNEGYRAQYLQGALYWKVMPDLSLTPNLGWQRNEYDGFPMQRSIRGGVSAIYHFDRNLSVLTALDMSRVEDTDDGFIRNTNSRGTSVSLGLRWAF